MNDLEKPYLDRYKKIIDDTIPNFANADEQLRFYEVMKREGLKLADVFIKSGGNLLDDIKNKFGPNSGIYKGISDDYVKTATDFIYMEINPNTVYINASDLSSSQKNKIENQNKLAISLINSLEKYYAGEKNKADIQTIKNKITAINNKLNLRN